MQLLFISLNISGIIGGTYTLARGVGICLELNIPDVLFNLGLFYSSYNPDWRHTMVLFTGMRFSDKM